MEDKKIRYEVPRNVKEGGLYWNLNWKGWVIVLTVSFFSGAATFFALGYSAPMFIVTGIIGILTHFTFQIDEKSGYYNFQLVFSYFENRSKDKTLTPQWGGNEHENNKIKKPVLVNIKAKKR